MAQTKIELLATIADKNTVIIAKNNLIIKAAKSIAQHLKTEQMLLDACKALLNSHGMHGPCEHHSCESCRTAYAKGREAIKASQSLNLAHNYNYI